MTRTTSWRKFGFDPVADKYEAGAIAPLDRGGGEQGGCLGRAIGLGTTRLGPESLARGNVDHEPNREQTFFDEPSDIGSPLTGRHVPVKMADIIAGFISFEFGEDESSARA